MAILSLSLSLSLSVYVTALVLICHEYIHVQCVHVLVYGLISNYFLICTNRYVCACVLVAAVSLSSYIVNITL